MIPFTPRRVKEPTFVFFCGRQRMRLKEVLEENLTTGWNIYPLCEIEDKLPPSVTVPVVYTRPDATEEDGRPCPKQGIWVFISYYDADDVKAFMVTVYNHPETLEQHWKVSQAYFREQELDRLWKKDPGPWDNIH